MVSVIPIRKLREITEKNRFNLTTAGLCDTPSLPCLYSAAEGPVLIFDSITPMVKV